MAHPKIKELYILQKGGSNHASPNSLDQKHHKQYGTKHIIIGSGVVISLILLLILLIKKRGALKPILKKILSLILWFCNYNHV